MHRTRFIVALLACLIAGPVFGQSAPLLRAAPKPDAPEVVSGQVGEFITIPVVTEGTSVQFVAMTPGLSVFPSEQLADPKSTVVIALTDGEYRLLSYTAVGNVPSFPAFTTVRIGKPVPVPPVPPIPPDPVPPVPPEPTPDDTQTLSEWVSANVPKLVNLDASTRTKDAVALAGEFSRVAGEHWETPSAVVTRMEAVARIALGGDAEAWQPFLDAMGDRLQGLAEAGKLVTLNDHDQMLRDLATGLRGAK